MCAPTLPEVPTEEDLSTNSSAQQNSCNSYLFLRPDQPTKPHYLSVYQLLSPPCLFDASES